MIYKALLFCSLCLWLSPAEAVMIKNLQPTFDCATAKYDDEKFVCADDDLAKLNEESNKWYQKQADYREKHLNNLPGFERDYVKQHQSKNTVQRLRCLQKGEQAKECLTEFYKKNIQSLKDTLLGFSLMMSCSGEGSEQCDFTLSDRLLATGADINGYIDNVPSKYCIISPVFPFMDGVPAYYMAIGNQTGSKALKYVLSKGAKLGMPGKFSASEFCRDFNLDEMKILLAHDVKTGESFSPPIFYKFLAEGIDSSDKVEIVKLFIQEIGEVDPVSSDPRTSLIMLLDNQKMRPETAEYAWKAAQELIAHGANVWQADKTGRNVLGYLEQNEVMKNSPYFESFRNLILYGEATVRPGFDCAKAETDAERLTCRDNELAQLDQEVNVWSQKIANYRTEQLTSATEVGNQKSDDARLVEYYYQRSGCSRSQKDFRDCVKKSYEQSLQYLKDKMQNLKAKNS